MSRCRRRIKEARSSPHDHDLCVSGCARSAHDAPDSSKLICRAGRDNLRLKDTADYYKDTADYYDLGKFVESCAGSGVGNFDYSRSIYDV